MFATISRKPLHRTLGAEWLEPRQPLAGDVGIALLGDQLVMEGDAQANAILIERPAGGGVDIRGSVAGDAATTINGGTEAFHVDSRLGNLMIDLGDGDDRLTLGTAGQNNASSLLASNGSFRFTGNLLANLGAGDDTFSADVAGAGNLTVMGGLGADDIAISGRAGTVSVIADGLKADAGSADSVQLSDLRANGDVNVFTVGGDDQIALSGDLRIQNDLAIDSGEGVDVLSLAVSHFVVRGELSIDPLVDNAQTTVNSNGLAGLAGSQSVFAGTSSLRASLATEFSNPLTPATAIGNTLLTADPVGAGSAGLALSANVLGGNQSLTSTSSLRADAALTPSGALVNGSLDAANMPSIGPLDGLALANLSLPADVRTTDLSATSDLNADASPSQAVLLQNAGALATSANPVAAVAADRVFNQFDESQLVGSAARNPTFLSNFSQDQSLNSALNQLALSQSFAPLF
jgi:hypothetical protein